MYERFFRFSERPFAVLPDSRRIFWTDGHRDAFSVLEAGFERLSQVTVLTGGIGTGKTTLIRHLLQTTSGTFSVGLLPNFAGERRDLLAWVLAAFGLDVSASSEARRFRRLETFLEGELQQGRRSVLIVDEAQNLSGRDLESLRLLSNMNAEAVLMMLVLVGQPQLRAKLAHIENQRLCQRIGADYHLEPLSQQETADFVRYRCVQAGGSPTLFDEEALDEVHRISGGVPRKINVLCDLALVSAFAEGVRKVDRRTVRVVVEDARRHGTYMSLTEGDGAAVAEAGVTAGSENTPGPPVPGASDHLVQRLAPIRQGAGSGSHGQSVPPQARGEGAPAAFPGFGSAAPSAPADSARLNALFGMAWPDDTLLFLKDPAQEDAASAPSGAQPEAPSPGGRSLGGAGRPATDDLAAGRCGPAAHRANDSDHLPIRHAPAGAEPALHDRAAPKALSAPASACPPSRGELELRQAFRRQPGWPRMGWRGAAVAAFAAGGSMAAGIAIALLPHDAAPVSQLATEMRPALPERVAETAAPSLPIALVQTVAADAARVAEGAVGVAPRGGSSASSATAVAEKPFVTDDRTRFAPVALADENPDVAEPAAKAARTITSPPARQAGTSARPAGAVAGDPVPSPPQLSAAEPIRLGQPRGLGTLEGAADVIPSVASLHDDPESPLNRPPGADASATVALRSITPAAPAAEAHAAHVGYGAMPGPAAAAPAAARSFPRDIVAAAGMQTAPVRSPTPLHSPGVSTPKKAEPASASLASESQARSIAEAAPRIAATAIPSAQTDPEALFRAAVDIALEDSRAAVVGYARAALLGHARAAYYLGQIYETGDGVPVDFVLARHWYQAAGGSRRAEDRLADLPRPQGGRMTAPLPLLAQPVDAVEADFVWTSGEGADPASYVVEISLDPNLGAHAVHALTGSAARLPLVEGATHWRVLALDATGKPSPASDWQAVSPDGSARSAVTEMPPDHL